MSKRRQKHEEHEEHVNHERWLVTYADMITLLMVLFIVLFAMGQTDLKKYQSLRQSLAVGFGGPDKMALLDGGAGISEGGASPAGIVPGEIAAKVALETVEKKAAAWQAEKATLEGAKSALESALKSGNGTGTSTVVSDGDIKVTVTSRGLVVTITSDAVLFDPGSAQLRSAGSAVLDRIAPQLVALPNQITIEGHTDNVPMSGTYPSNWELSTARASSVLRDLIDVHGLPPARGAASGYADQRPLGDNTTYEGRARNRRVEIVLVAAVADPSADTKAIEDAISAAEAAAAGAAEQGGARDGDATVTTLAAGINTVHESTATAHESTATAHESTATAHESTATAHESTATAHESTATAHESTATAHESTATTKVVAAINTVAPSATHEATASTRASTAATAHETTETTAKATVTTGHGSVAGAAQVTATTTASADAAHGSSTPNEEDMLDVSPTVAVSDGSH